VGLGNIDTNSNGNKFMRLIKIKFKRSNLAFKLNIKSNIKLINIVIKSKSFLNLLI
jgi:hypothetical protein